MVEMPAVPGIFEQITWYCGMCGSPYQTDSKGNMGKYGNMDARKLHNCTANPSVAFNNIGYSRAGTNGTTNAPRSNGMCEDPVVAGIKLQMASLDKIHASLEGCNDALAMQWRRDAEQRLKDLRIKVTQTRSLDDQVQMLEALVAVARKAGQKREAEDALESAQQCFDNVSRDLATAVDELLNLRRQIAPQAAIAASADRASMTASGGQMREVFKEVESLPPSLPRKSVISIPCNLRSVIYNPLLSWSSHAGGVGGNGGSL